MQWIQKLLQVCRHIVKYIAIIILLYLGASIMITAIFWGRIIINWNYDYGYRVREVYATIGGRYDIGWDKEHYTKFCDKQAVTQCSQLYLRGAKVINENEAYIYFRLDNNRGINVRTIDVNRFYSYYVFSTKQEVIVHSLDDIPQYGYIQWSELHLYSPKDMKTLDPAKVAIFEELTKNPTIIINGKSYKHHDDASIEDAEQRAKTPARPPLPVP